MDPPCNRICPRKKFRIKFSLSNFYLTIFVKIMFLNDAFEWSPCSRIGPDTVSFQSIAAGVTPATGWLSMIFTPFSVTVRWRL